MSNCLNCILLAERHRGLSDGLGDLLKTVFGVVVMVSDETSLLEVANRLQPEMVIVDLSLAASSNLNWLHTVRQSSPNSKVIVLSVHDEQSVHDAVIQAGADALVVKHAIATELLSIVDGLRRAA